jgi:hypothetical protein
METMKAEALKFLTERTNITSKTGASLVNRALSVIGKEHSTTRGAISGLISSWKALANDEKTNEADALEVHYLADVLSVLILPACEAIDASVKAKQASKTNTNKPANGKREAWADTQEEAQALRAELAPTKPARGRKAEAPAQALDLDALARVLGEMLAGR